VGFALHYLFALGVVAVLLLGLNAGARMFARAREAPGAQKTVRVLDSAALTKQASLHVAGVDGRRYLLAAAGDCVVLLAELEVAQPPDFIRGGFRKIDLGIGAK
jgi:flagellar biogenesis protein FliO